MKTVILNDVEFHAVRENIYVPAANNVKHIWKKGWQLYRNGRLVLSGAPRAKYNYRAAEVAYPTFADLSAEWDDDRGINRIINLSNRG